MVENARRFFKSSWNTARADPYTTVNAATPSSASITPIDWAVCTP